MLQVWGCLKKTKGECIMINPRAPKMNESVEECEANFSDQCPDADEELDEKFPKPVMQKFQTTALMGADHSCAKKT